MRRALRTVAALALLGGLASCTAAPEPEPVGAYREPALDEPGGFLGPVVPVSR